MLQKQRSPVILIIFGSGPEFFYPGYVYKIIDTIIFMGYVYKI